MSKQQLNRLNLNSMDSLQSLQSMPSIGSSISFMNSHSRKTQRDMALPFIFREGSSGYWAAVLLPLAIYLSDVKFSSVSLTPVVIIVYNSAVLSIVYSMDKQRFHLILEKLKFFSFLLALICLGCCYFLSKGNIYEYAAYVTLCFTYPYIFRNFVHHYPRSFTFGEAMIVTAAFVYNFWIISQNLILGNHIVDVQKASDSVLVTLATELTFFGTLLLARGLLFYASPSRFFVLEELLCLWAKGSLLGFVLKLPNPTEDIWFMFYWVLGYFFGSNERVVYLVYWLMLVWVSGSYVYLKSHEDRPTSIIDRKFFHVVITLVYFPVIVNDFSFIFFCSAVVFNMFLIVEAVRVLRIEFLGIQFGTMINDLVFRFRDNRDSGPLILTPVYLLVGCSLPIWLTGLHSDHRNTNDLPPEDVAAALTGILSIGIGDTVASVVGSQYGQIHWPGSRKTVEGTAASMIAQILVVFLLILSGHLPYSALSIFALIVSSVINALVEAWTDQIDNLVVPLVAFIAVHGVFGIYYL